MKRCQIAQIINIHVHAIIHTTMTFMFSLHDIGAYVILHVYRSSCRMICSLSLNSLFKNLSVGPVLDVIICIESLKWHHCFNYSVEKLTHFSKATTCWLMQQDTKVITSDRFYCLKLSHFIGHVYTPYLVRTPPTNCQLKSISRQVLLHWIYQLTV